MPVTRATPSGGGATRGNAKGDTRGARSTVNTGVGEALVAARTEQLLPEQRNPHATVAPTRPSPRKIGSDCSGWRVGPNRTKVGTTGPEHGRGVSAVQAWPDASNVKPVSVATSSGTAGDAAS